MKDLDKMMLFLFLGLVIAILALGFHRSGPPIGTASGNTTTSTPTYPVTSTQTSSNPYEMEG